MKEGLSEAPTSQSLVKNVIEQGQTYKQGHRCFKMGTLPGGHHKD
jgi:hypothetical protein